MSKQTDPVCKMQIEESEAFGQSEYEGQTYYFCSESCKKQFDVNPKSFTNKTEAE
jgi:YHS domain-containing protein